LFEPKHSVCSKLTGILFLEDDVNAKVSAEKSSFVAVNNTVDINITNAFK